MQLNGTYKDILSISIPIVIGSLAQSITQVVDTAFLGHVGEIELGAGNIAGLYFMFLLLTTMAFTRGSQVIIARRAGSSDYAGVGQVFRHTIIMTTVLIIALLILLLTFTDSIFSAIIQSPDISEASKTYIYFRIPGLPFSLLNICFFAFYSGIGKTRIITIATVVLGLVNIVLDYSLIFGHLGLPALGIKGAALASSFADLAMFITYVVHLVITKHRKTFHLFSQITLSKTLFKRMFEISAPLILQTIIGLFSWQLFFILIEKTGMRALAISSIAKSFYMFIGIPIWGLSSTANTVVSNLLGQEKKEEILLAIRKMLNLGILFSIVITTSMFYLPNIFLGIYTPDLILIKETVPVYRVILFAMFLFSIGTILMQSIMGLGSTKYILFMETTTVLVYISYLYFSIFIFQLSLAQIWCAEFIYWFMISLLSFLYIRKKPWFNENFKTVL